VRHVRRAVVSIAIVRRYLQRMRQCKIIVFVIKVPSVVRFKSRRTVEVSCKASERLEAYHLLPTRRHADEARQSKSALWMEIRHCSPFAKHSRLVVKASESLNFGIDVVMLSRVCGAGVVEN
jgi:hypothetical protein